MLMARIEKIFLKILIVLCFGSLAIFGLITPFYKQTKKPQIFVVEPTGQQATFQLRTSTPQISNVGDTLSVEIWLNTTADSDAAEALVSFDPTKLEPVDANGNVINSDTQVNQAIQQGSLYSFYLYPAMYMDPTELAAKGLRLAEGKIDIVGGLTAGSIPYNSNGTPGLFAKIYFKAKDNTGSTTVSLVTAADPQDGVSSSVSIKGGPSDILNQDLLPNDGNLVINFGAQP
jgi:hypothetical protein